MVSLCIISWIFTGLRPIYLEKFWSLIVIQRVSGLSTPILATVTLQWHLCITEGVSGKVWIRIQAFWLPVRTLFFTSLLNSQFPIFSTLMPYLYIYTLGKFLPWKDNKGKHLGRKLKTKNQIQERPLAFGGAFMMKSHLFHIFCRTSGSRWWQQSCCYNAVLCLPGVPRAPWASWLRLTSSFLVMEAVPSWPPKDQPILKSTLRQPRLEEVRRSYWKMGRMSGS